jgi:hypothetical protein
MRETLQDWLSAKTARALSIKVETGFPELYVSRPFGRFDVGDFRDEERARS